MRKFFMYVLPALLCPNLASANDGATIGQALSPLWVAPFVLMLLGIAILPLTVDSWWHLNKNKAIFSAVLGLPVVALFLWAEPGVLVHTTLEFISFIILLAALFIVSGGIVVQTDLRATPLVNSCFLALGAILASIMGTTGAAMLLIRPLLETNSQRTKKTHTVVFFIFLVANIGGLLTPLGDPPLFMGYLKGVPFIWTLGTLIPWAATVAALLIVYFLIDSYIVTKESISALKKDLIEEKKTQIRGMWPNFLLLAGIVICVGFLTDKVVPFPIREVALVAISLLSLWLTKKEDRQANKFSYYPIIEVAVLFAGIFATMIPAIEILKARGGELAVATPTAFFWATGVLSSFLDNTPTYVVFFSLAQNPDIPAISQSVASTGVDELILRAISVGAVFMGANTYIGNAPNFMVKSIAEERGVKMPSFLGYMLWSIAILIPTFVALDWCLFR